MVTVAVSPVAIFDILALCGILGVLVAGLWSLIVAAQRGVLWLLAVLIFPIANIILLFIEPKSRPPFLMSLLACGAVASAYFNAPLDKENRRQLFTSLRPEKSEVPAAEPLEVRKENIKQWQSRLEARKRALKPGDLLAETAFQAEMNRYMVELESVKKQIQLEAAAAK